MNAQQIENIFDGCAFLEHFGNLYEWCGKENEFHIFQNVSDDSYIRVSYRQLMCMKEYHCVE